MVRRSRSLLQLGSPNAGRQTRLPNDSPSRTQKRSNCQGYAAVKYARTAIVIVDQEEMFLRFLDRCMVKIINVGTMPDARDPADPTLPSNRLFRSGQMTEITTEDCEVTFGSHTAKTYQMTMHDSFYIRTHGRSIDFITAYGYSKASMYKHIDNGTIVAYKEQESGVTDEIISFDVVDAKYKDLYMMSLRRFVSPSEFLDMNKVDRSVTKFLSLL